jgi:HK97 gp10 family phage protein
MMSDGGLSRIQQRLNAIPRTVKEALVPALTKQADTIADTMRVMVPVDKGDLKASIATTGPGEMTPYFSQPGGRGLVPENAVAITAGGEEARTPHLVEYGTKKSKAQPYFWPAYRLHRDKAKKALKSAARAAVKKNWGKPS